jgi:transcription-repair coupling factor (superfamily II helicase)
MRETIKVENFPLYFAARVSRALDIQSGKIRISGCHSPLGLALLLSQGQSSKLGARPQVVITSEHAEAEHFRDSVHSIDPQAPVHVLPPFDVEVYSTLYPNHKVIAERLLFLNKALNAKPGEVFVASVEAIMQKTLPASKFQKASLTLRKNDSLPDRFADFMSRIGYVSTPTVEDVGTFFAGRAPSVPH